VKEIIAGVAVAVSGFFAPLPFHPLADSSPGTFAPWHFCPLAFSPLAYSPSGSFTLALWTIRPLARLPRGLFTPWLIHPLTLDDLPPLCNSCYLLFKNAIFAAKIPFWGKYTIESQKF